LRVDPQIEIEVNDLLEDTRGSLWIAGFGGLFRRQSDGTTTHFNKRDDLPDDTIHKLLEDNHGQLWVGTRYGGFFRFAVDESSGKALVTDVYRLRNRFVSDWIFDLYQTSDHRFWVATNKGLVEFFPESKGQSTRFRSYTTRNGLTYYEITALSEDPAGNLWLG